MFQGVSTFHGVSTILRKDRAREKVSKAVRRRARVREGQSGDLDLDYMLTFLPCVLVQDSTLEPVLLDTLFFFLSY